jgi:hypothetical protein
MVKELKLKLRLSTKTRQKLKREFIEGTDTERLCLSKALPGTLVGRSLHVTISESMTLIGRITEQTFDAQDVVCSGDPYHPLIRPEHVTVVLFHEDFLARRIRSGEKVTL